jgi:hypothetical protein
MVSRRRRSHPPRGDGSAAQHTHAPDPLRRRLAASAHAVFGSPIATASDPVVARAVADWAECSDGGPHERFPAVVAVLPGQRKQ